MKKFLSVILAVILSIGCFATVASAKPTHSFITESGVEVFIEPFLYKSNTYSMQFPNAEDYSVKDSSTPGDYAIPGELNDLSYVLVLPAGTTKLNFRVSVDKERWHGVYLDYNQHAQYWEKDENGEADLTKPLTFERSETTAEQDEYGLLYRYEMYGKDIGGFRDYDKVYWKIDYICNGENFSDIFEIPLIDYDSPNKLTVKALNYNVGGLPWATSASAQRANGKFIADNGSDIVALQEDFGYHKQLVDGLSGYNYISNHTGGVPGGDGLSQFTKNMTIYNEERVTWDKAYGVFDHGADEMTPKGFSYSVIDIGDGIYIDFYNLHADAYGDDGSAEARYDQYKQLTDFIAARSKENDRPVIVTGDFNVYMHTHDANSDLYEFFVKQGGFKDAWIEVKNDSDYYNLGKWFATDLPAWGNWDSVERFFYRGGGGVSVIATDFRYIEVLGENGKPLSDHSAAECTFEFFKTVDFVENTQELKVTEDLGTGGFMHTLEWIVKDFINAITHLEQIYTAIVRVIEENSKK